MSPVVVVLLGEAQAWVDDDPLGSDSCGDGCVTPLVDLPPSAMRASPRWTAASVSYHRPPSENESGVTLRMPITWHQLSQGVSLRLLARPVREEPDGSLGHSDRVGDEHRHRHRPHPPGTGLMWLESGATFSKSTSPTTPPRGRRLMPTSTTTTPGLTMSAVMSPGLPAAGVSGTTATCSGCGSAPVAGRAPKVSDGPTPTAWGRCGVRRGCTRTGGGSLRGAAGRRRER